MARNCLLLAILVGSGLAGIGCKGYDTPRSLRGSERPDRPDLPISEQERRGRARYALPEDDRTSPRGYIDRPSPTGR